MSTKISTVINGVHSGTIVLPGDVLTCQMAGQSVDSAWMIDGTTEQDVENAVLRGKMVVCTLLNQSISSEPITLFAQSILSPYPLFTGVCKVGQNLAYVTASYDEVNSTSESEVWAINKQNLLPSYINNSGKVLAVNNSEDGLEWVPQSGGGITIDTELSESSTNPVQNKAINVLTRKLWNRVNIVSRLGNEYARANNRIIDGVWQSSSSLRHWAVPVDDIRCVTVQANSSQYAVLTFLKTYNSTTGTPDFATGYSDNIRVDAGKTITINVPHDANYMIIMTGSSNTRKPANVYLTGIAVNHPPLTYIQLVYGATTCDISLTDTKQSFVIDNSENINNVSINITNLYDYVYSNEHITAGKGIVTQFDFESVEVGQNTYLFVIQTVMYDRTLNS